MKQTVLYFNTGSIHQSCSVHTKALSDGEDFKVICDEAQRRKIKALHKVLQTMYNGVLNCISLPISKLSSHKAFTMVEISVSCCFFSFFDNYTLSALWKGYILEAPVTT